jgi:hypothetical protein
MQSGESGLQIGDASQSDSEVAFEIVPADGVALCPSGSCLGGFGAPGGSSERRLELSEASGEPAGAVEAPAFGETGAVGGLALGVRRVHALSAHRRSASSSTRTPPAFQALAAPDPPQAQTSRYETLFVAHRWHPRLTGRLGPDSAGHGPGDRLAVGDTDMVGLEVLLERCHDRSPEVPDAEREAEDVEGDLEAHPCR